MYTLDAFINLWEVSESVSNVTVASFGEDEVV